MHVVALNWSHEDMRFKAMLQCNPFHSYMFNSQGTLLCASAAAIESGACRTAGRQIHCTAGHLQPAPNVQFQLQASNCYNTLSV